MRRLAFALLACAACAIASAATVSVSKVYDGGGERTYLWETLTNTNLDGSAVSTPGLPFKAVQVIGTFNGATVTFQGSNDGTNWFTLKDPGGSNLAFTAAGGGQVFIATARYIRPLVSSAGASTDLDCYLYVSR